MSSSMSRPTISPSDVEESEYSGFGFRRVVAARFSLGVLGTALGFGGGATFGAALPFGRPRGLFTGTYSMASTIGSGGDSASSSASGVQLFRSHWRCHR